MQSEFETSKGPVTPTQALIIGILALEGGKMNHDNLKAEFADRMRRHGSVLNAARAVLDEYRPPADTQGFTL